MGMWWVLSWGGEGRGRSHAVNRNQEPGHLSLCPWDPPQGVAQSTFFLIEVQKLVMGVNDRAGVSQLASVARFHAQCSRGLLQPLAKAGTRPSSSLMVLILPNTAFHPRIRQNLITTISASLRPVFHLSAELLALAFSAPGEELWHQGCLGAYVRLRHKPDPESGTQISIF